MKFYVRKKIGDMHVTGGGGGGGGGEFYRSLHGPKSKLLVLCLLQKAHCMWGTLRNNWFWIITEPIIVFDIFL